MTGLTARHRLTIAGVTVALLWSLFLVLPHLRGEATILDRIEAPLADLRFLVTGPRPAPADIVVVAIDDDTVRAAGAYPLPRPVMARLVRTLLQAQPKAVALDVLFLDAGKAEIDADLAAALASGPTVVAMAAAFPRLGPENRASYGPFDNLPVAERLLKPVDPIAGSTRLGLVNISADHGGTPRHIPLLVSTDGTLHPALPLRVASLVAGGKFELARDQVQAGPIGTPVDLAAALAIRFYGPQGSFSTVSAQAVLEGRGGDSLRDRILIVGATAFGNGDTLPTPFDPVLPGVELLATGIAHLTNGDALVRTTNVRRADAAVTLGLPALLVLMMASRRVAIGLALAALVLAGFCAAAIILFTQGIWLAMAMPLAAALPAVILYGGARLLLDRWLERRLEAQRDSLLRFHAPALAARLASEPDFLDVPVEQQAAILFIDLSGFTGLAERVGPVRTQALLKEMHDLIEEAVSKRGGSVTSFMGDGAMVLFGLPEARDDDPDRAVATALALARTLDTWLARRTAEVGPAIGLRIGVHAGPVVISRLGGARNQHITATGDTVNVASRLMEVAKSEGAQIVLSAELLEARRDPSALPGLGPAKRVPVRGRVQSLDVHCIRRGAAR